MDVLDWVWKMTKRWMKSINMTREITPPDILNVATDYILRNKTAPVGNRVLCVRICVPVVGGYHV